MKQIWYTLCCAIMLVRCGEKEINVPSFPKNIVVAHRGAWKQKGYPQNSIAALRRAIQMQCIGSEFDAWLTLDDSLVVTHDPTYGGRIVERSKYADLAKKRLSNGEILPTLQQYLLAAINQNQTKLFIEIKSESFDVQRWNLVTDRVLALVDELNAGSLMVYTSFYLPVLQRIHQLKPGADVQFLGGYYTPTQLKIAGVTGVDYSIDTFLHRQTWITNAKQDSLELNAWIVNDIKQMSWVVAHGFDYVTTDEPERLFMITKPQ